MCTASRVGAEGLADVGEHGVQVDADGLQRLGVGRAEHGPAGHGLGEAVASETGGDEGVMRPAGLPGQGEQQVLGAELPLPHGLSLFLGLRDHRARRPAEPFEHHSS
jgi:hypothetical protein